MKKPWKQWMAITCSLAMIGSLLPGTILAAKDAVLDACDVKDGELVRLEAEKTQMEYG